MTGGQIWAVGARGGHIWIMHGHAMVRRRPSVSRDDGVALLVEFKGMDEPIQFGTNAAAGVAGR